MNSPLSRHCWMLLMVAVAVIAPGCHRNKSSSGAPAAPVLGSATINTSGGVGTNGNGGNGGAISIDHNLASPLTVSRYGTFDTTGFVVPTGSVELGANARTFMTPGAATLTPTVGSTAILGDDGLTPATGLRVGPGVTLTIDTNFPGAGVRNLVSLIFTHAVIIEGSIIAERADQAVAGDELSTSRSNLTIACSNVVMATGSLIDTSGVDDVANPGGAGGDITFSPTGTVVLRGAIDTRGGDGTVGGAGGFCQILAGGGFYHFGTVTLDGGTGSTGAGGNGGGVNWTAGQIFQPVPMINTGTFTGRGGGGATGGGAGADTTGTAFPGICYVENSGAGLYVNTGSFDFSGGDCTGTNGNGGSVISQLVWGNNYGVGPTTEVRTMGTITGRGGRGGSVSGNGGNGPIVRIRAIINGGVAGQDNLRGFFCGTTIDARGGDALGTSATSAGGNGGPVIIDTPVIGGTNSAQPGQAPVQIVGYLSFTTSGGAATDPANGNGGNAGGVTILNNQQNDPQLVPWIASIHNDVPITAVGGSSTGGIGGNGGSVTLSTTNTATATTGFLDRYVRNEADIDARGGDGALPGGFGGSFTMHDHVFVHNTGDFNGNGGAGNTGGGGQGGTVSLTSYQRVRNEGNLTKNGGASNSGVGGVANAASLTLSAPTAAFASRSVFNSGDIAAQGGASTISNGGVAGAVTISTGATAPFAASQFTTNEGDILAVGGSGGVDGAAGGAVSIFDHQSSANSGAINASGGAGGSGNGAAGGAVTISADIGVLNTGSIQADGGGSTSAAGGAGGAVQVTTATATGYFPTGSTENRGTIQTRGGTGGTTGGAGGGVDVYDHFTTTNTGAIDARGGGGGSGNGGAGGAVSVRSDITVSNAAAITTQGGASTGAAGANGGNVTVIGEWASHSGNVDARGGNASTTGGNGATINVMSSFGLSSVSNALMNVAAGTGATPGTIGRVRIDGIEVDLGNNGQVQL